MCIRDRGKGFTILAVAEGAISKEDAALSKKDFKEKPVSYTHLDVYKRQVYTAGL